MRLSRVVRTGNPVGPGWSGYVPPAEMLRTFETVPDAGSLPAALTRAEGSRAFRADGALAWDRLAGVWRDLSAFGALYAASSNLGTLIALASMTGFPGNLLALGAAQNAGPMAPGGWADTQALRMKAAVPNLTGFYAQKLSHFPNATLTLPAGLATADVEGGGLVCTANNHRLSGPVVVAPKTSEWAISVRAAFPAPVAGQYAFVGMQVGAGPKSIKVGTWHAAGPVGAQTKLILLQYTDVGPHQVCTVTSHAPAGTWHDVMFTLSGATLKVWVDGVEVGSELDLTDVPTSACSLCVEAGTTSLYLNQYAIGFVAP